MRATQMIGLTKNALSYIDENCVKVASYVCPKCGNKDKLVPAAIGYGIYYGICREPYPLHTYKNKNGELVKEVLQADPWSSGPVVFLCLEINGKRMFKWSQKEIERRSS